MHCIEWWSAGVVTCLPVSGATCRFAYGPADLTDTVVSVKSRLILPFWYQLIRVVPDKEPLYDVVVVATTP